MYYQAVIPAVLLLSGMVAAFYGRKLTLAGAIAGGTTGALVFAGAGYTGLSMLAAFFVLGTAATGFKKNYKKTLYDKLFTGGRDMAVLLKHSTSPVEPSGRTAGQVLANGGMAGLCGLLIIAFPGKAPLLGLMMAASLASATADTLASELGILYGRSFYNCMSWKKDSPGLDGVISPEGTLIGFGGALIIALIYCSGSMILAESWTGSTLQGMRELLRPLLTITLAGALGNFSDSVLGAGPERKGLLSNDGVNFLSTLIAALIAGLIATIWI